MAAILTNKSDIYGIYEFTVDAVADISKLPTTTEGGADELAYIDHGVRQGSTAFVIATSAVYMLDGTGTWVTI